MVLTSNMHWCHYHLQACQVHSKDNNTLGSLPSMPSRCASHLDPPVLVRTASLPLLASAVLHCLTRPAGLCSTALLLEPCVHPRACAAHLPCEPHTKLCALYQCGTTPSNMHSQKQRMLKNSQKCRLNCKTISSHRTLTASRHILASCPALWLLSQQSPIRYVTLWQCQLAQLIVTHQGVLGRYKLYCPSTLYHPALQRGYPGSTSTPQSCLQPGRQLQTIEASHAYSWYH